MLPTIIVAVLILALLFFAVRYMLKNRGSCSHCSGNCAACKRYQKELNKEKK